MTDPIVEKVARAIAKAVMRGDSGRVGPDLSDVPEGPFNKAFDKIWRGTNDLDARQRDAYRKQARAAIAAHLSALADAGMVVVPREAGPEIEKIAGDLGIGPKTADGLYRAMLTAAPKPEMSE